MKLTAAAALLAVASCSALGSPSEPATSEQSIQVYLGQRTLDEDDWEPVEEQGTFGVEYSLEPDDGVGWELGILGSQAEDDARILGVDVDVKGWTNEFYGGLRKTFGTSDARVAPYLGGGLSLLSAKLQVKALGEKEKEDDSSLAGYLHAGVTFDVTQSFFVGLDLRLLFGSDLEFGGVSGDGDYEQLAVVLGFGF